MKQGWYQDATEPSQAHYWDGSGWTGETRPLAAASPLYSPTGSHYWDGMQWLPDPDGEEKLDTSANSTVPPFPSPLSASTSYQKTLAETQGKQSKERKGSPSFIKLIITLVVAVVLATFGLNFIQSIGSGTTILEPTSTTPLTAIPGDGESGDVYSTLQSELNRTAKVLETFYTDNSSYPTAEELSATLRADYKEPFISAGTTIYVAYYDRNGFPAPTLESAEAYKMCAASPATGNALLYSSFEGGLGYQMKESGEGVNPCGQMLVIGNTAWDPADLYLQIKGSEVM